MRQSLVTKSIILRKDAHGEADLYLTVLTQNHGVLRLLAKSARKSKKRFVGGLDLFCHIDASISKKRDAYLLEELTVLNAFMGLRDSLDRVTTAGKIAHWTWKILPPEQPNAQAYSLLGQTLSLAEKETDPARLQLLNLVFRVKFLSLLGIKPKTDVCLVCHEAGEGPGYFELGAGAFACSQCFPKSGLTGARILSFEERLFLEGAEHFRLTHWGGLTFPPRATENLNHLVASFARFHTHTALLD